MRWRLGGILVVLLRCPSQTLDRDPDRASARTTSPQGHSEEETSKSKLVERPAAVTLAYQKEKVGGRSRLGPPFTKQLASSWRLDRYKLLGT